MEEALLVILIYVCSVIILLHHENNFNFVAFDVQVSGITTVELNVNMHCEACAGQLKKKILQMRGI